MNTRLLFLAVLLIAICAALFFVPIGGQKDKSATQEQTATTETISTKSTDPNTQSPKIAPDRTVPTKPTQTTTASEVVAESETPEPETAEEKEERIQEAITKSWEQSLEKFSSDEGKLRPVTSADRKRMAETLARIKDPDEKKFAIAQAVNELPDETFGVLDDILFDKNQDKDLLDDIFHDLLNRDEALKTPILKALAAATGHPLQEEAAEILKDSE